MILDSNNTVTRRNSLQVYGIWWPENPPPPHSPPHKTPPSFLMLLFFTKLHLFPANICFLYLPVQTRTIFEVGWTVDTSFRKPLLLVIRFFHRPLLSSSLHHNVNPAAITNQLLITGCCMWSCNETSPAPNVAVSTIQLLV